MGLFVVHLVPLGVVLARLPKAQREAVGERRLEDGVRVGELRQCPVFVDDGIAFAPIAREPGLGKSRGRGLGLGGRLRLGRGLGLRRRCLHGGRFRLGGGRRERVRHRDAHRRQRHHGHADDKTCALLLGRDRRRNGCGLAISPGWGGAFRGNLRSAARSLCARRHFFSHRRPALRAELGTIWHFVAAFGTEHGGTS